MRVTAIGIIAILIEVLCGKMVLDIFLEKKNKAGIGRMFIILSVFVIAGFVIATVFQNYIYIRIPIVFIVGVALWKQYYRDSIFKIGLIYLIFMATATLLDYFTVICIFKLNPQTTIIASASNTFEVLTTMLCKTSYIVVILILWRLFKKKTVEYMNIKGWLCTFVFSIFTLVVTVMLAANWSIVQNETQSNILLSISVGLVVMNIFMFYVIHNILETEAETREKDIFKERLTKEIESYHTMEENAAAQRAMIHEFRNVLSVISASVDKGSNEVAELAKREYHKLNEIGDSINTQNIIVNMVLNAKIKEIRKKRIGVLLDIGDLSGLRMEHEDIIIILSNLINNAIEACEQCQDKKIIWIKCMKRESEVLFSVRNTYSIEPIVQNGKYITTKTEDREMHGMGIDNIIRVVENYGGAYAIQAENQEFTFTIIIPE